MLFAGSEEAATEPPPYIHHDCRDLSADALASSCRLVAFNSLYEFVVSQRHPLLGSRLSGLLKETFDGKQTV